MKKTADDGKHGGISDAAVRKATGKSWSAWFGILDEAGAKKKDHRGITAILDGRAGLSGWWCQMLTVGYEQARGLRQIHQKPDAYEISASKTVAAPLPALFRAWSDSRARKAWLRDPDFTVRKATANKSMRITWVDGKTSVSANFYAKGAGKSQVALQHGKLASPAAASRMKSYWAGQLERLDSVIGREAPARASG
jgi:hypothetical protein